MTLFLPPNDDTDFMDALDAAAHLQPPRVVLAMMMTIMALAVIAILWAAVSSVEIIARGEGRVVPTRDIQIVQSLEGGIVSEVLVQEGDQVKKGQVILRISDVQFSSEERGTEAKFLSLNARKARLEAEAKGVEFVMPDDIKTKSPQIAANEQALYESRRKEIENAYAILQDRIGKAEAELEEVKANSGRLAESKRLLEKELEITREMVRQRASPKLEQIRLEREMSDASGQINALGQKQKALSADLEAARKEKDGQAGRFKSQALAELNETETQIAGLNESLKSIGDRVDRAEVRSPVDGVVNNIAIKTVGGVIEPAMKLAEIVPLDDTLKVVARIRPEDVAFIRAGQPAKIKITAYDAQKYGALDAKLVRVGANSVSDRDGKVFFEVELATAKNHMGPDSAKLPVTPGMVAHAEIITGRRKILEYLMKPVLRARDVALTER